MTGVDIYGELLGIRAEVGHVLQRIEASAATVAFTAGQVADHETRLRVLRDQVPANLDGRLITLERWQWRATGMVLLAAFIMSAMGAYIGYLLGHK